MSDCFFQEAVMCPIAFLLIADTASDIFPSRLLTRASGRGFFFLSRKWNIEGRTLGPLRKSDEGLTTSPSRPTNRLFKGIVCHAMCLDTIEESVYFCLHEK